MRDQGLPRARLTLLAASAVLFLFEIPRAEAQCSTAEQIDLVTAGYSRAEIYELCSQQRAPTYDPYEQRSPYPAPNYQRPAYANYCVTQFGACTMMQAAPVGGSCYCTTAYGVFPGVTQ